MSWAQIAARNLPEKAPSSSSRSKVATQQPKAKLTSSNESTFPMIDIGSNLTSTKFKHDLNDIIKRARDAHVKKQIITGSTVKDSLKAQKLAHHYPNEFYSTAGIHPHHAKEHDANTLEELESLLKHPEVVAVGETGLDYFRNLSSPEKQKESFKAHLELAIKHHKPLFLHQRDAHEDFMTVFEEVMTKHQLDWKDLPPVVVHCFTGTAKELQHYVKVGFYVGITGFIGIKGRGDKLQKFLASKLPLKRLMIETDAPYMKPSDAPKLVSGQNEPCNLKYVARILAKLYQVSEDTIRQKTTENAEKFFNLNSQDK